MQGVQEGKSKLRAFKIAAIVIFSVVIVEVTIGTLVNSLAIVSDGLHALLDAFSSVMLYFAVRASLKPADEEHTYGHEKFETIGGLIAGIVLIAVACLIFYEAATRLIAGVSLESGNVEYAGFIAIAYALSISMLRITVFKKGKKSESQSMKAGFYDAIADLGSTLIALIGFGLALIGFAGADAFASIFLGCMLTYLSLKLARASINELSDSASKDIVAKTQKAISSCEGVLKTENLKVRKVGSKVFIDASVSVPNGMGLEDAHNLTSRIESCLKDALGNVDATIHVEPVDKEKKLRKEVAKLASVDGVREVHEVSANYVNSKLYITLHAYVDPELSVEAAHKIAEKIESKIYLEIKPLENVTVHIEPAGQAVPVEQFSEEKLKEDVCNQAKEIGGNLEIKRVLTYIAEGKRFINIDCCFTKEVHIKEAHHLASLLEKRVRENFVNTIVTVHIEPQCKDQSLGHFV
jgi:cation diffusion facilitator family transporter